MATVGVDDSISQKDRQTIRDLAEKVAEIAALPIQAEKIRLWTSLNNLKPIRPCIAADPQNGWLELVGEDDLVCDNYRWIELTLRRQVFRHEYIHDDWPILPRLSTYPVVHDIGFGLDEHLIRTEAHGAYKIDPPIKSHADFAKVRHRQWDYDKAATIDGMDRLRDLVGDFLEVKPGPTSFRFGLTHLLVHLRGLDQLFIDMYDDPAFLHEMMAFMRDDLIEYCRFVESEGVVTSNNDPEHILGVGGLGPVDDLPKPDPSKPASLRDCWCWAESQETVGVGPKQFEEFVLEYQLPLMEMFGMSNYGCCEPLDTRLDALLARSPRLRAVAVPPWSNREFCAGKLQDKYVYCYKPNPSRICSPTPDYEAAERELRETLKIAEGCCVSLVMKDTSTFHNERERITRWTDMAQRLAGESGGV